ncbi:MAG: PEP-CTERM sorting domain-containing protein [Akkermansiaceae bacterium]
MGRILLVGSALAMPTASAAVISNFDFTGPPWAAAKENDFATFAAAAGSVDTELNTTTSDLSKTANIDGGGYASFYIREVDGPFGIFTGTASAGVGMNFADVEEATATNYISFTVTPAAMIEATYESLSLYAGTNAGDVEFSLRSWDGAAETTLGNYSFVDPNPGEGAATNDAITAHTFDFTDFASSSATEFRLYAWGGTNANTGVRLDDIVLNGTVVAIPEPSSAVLLSLAGLGLLKRRRRS